MGLYIGNFKNEELVGKKIPTLQPNFYLNIMAYSSGYFMCRYRGCSPFVCNRKGLQERLNRE
jgi:hypothetical protein